MPTPKSSTPEPNALGLLTIAEAMRLTGHKRTAFWRWRKKNRVPLCAGGRVHIDDITNAINRERGVITKFSNQK